jgi:hypothetical protein
LYIIGYGSSVAPTYINEVSPRHLRGTLGVVFQLGVVLFIFLSQVITLNSILGSADRWNYAIGKKFFSKKFFCQNKFFCFVGLSIVFSIMQVILLFFVPESPKYLLLKKNDPIKAEEGLF